MPRGVSCAGLPLAGWEHRADAQTKHGRRWNTLPRAAPAQRRATSHLLDAAGPCSGSNDIALGHQATTAYCPVRSRIAADITDRDVKSTREPPICAAIGRMLPTVVVARKRSIWTLAVPSDCPVVAVANLA